MGLLKSSVWKLGLERLECLTCSSGSSDGSKQWQISNQSRWNIFESILIFSKWDFLKELERNEWKINYPVIKSIIPFCVKILLSTFFTSQQHKVSVFLAKRWQIFKSNRCSTFSGFLFFLQNTKKKIQSFLSFLKTNVVWNPDKWWGALVAINTSTWVPRFESHHWQKYLCKPSNV